MSKIAIQNNIFVEPRQRLIDWVRKQLIGPPERVGSSPDLVGVLPTERFPVGALYPITPAGEGIDPASEDELEEEAPANGSGEAKGEPTVVRRYTPPSSLGFSFFISGDDISFQVLCQAASYKREDKRGDDGRYKSFSWMREELAVGSLESEGCINVKCPSNDLRRSFVSLSGKARIDIEWRRFAGGWLVTITLCNASDISSKEQSATDFVFERAEKTLFEASLRCVIETGVVGSYPRVDRSLLDDEEQEIELQYIQRNVYAIGHGCSAQWVSADGKVLEIFSDTMPTVDVPQMTADTGAQGDSVLSLAKLAEINTQHEGVQSALAAFVDGYAKWITEQDGSIAGQEDDDHAAAKRIVRRMHDAESRMCAGLDLLMKDEQARLAFSIANRAMLDQMCQNDRLQGKHRSVETYCWRPFQLAFLLTTLESAANPDSDYRDTLDLIWFPTGGGKTEAYLGLIAFQVALRRLRHPDSGGGTAVLMRYTLRLLTRDQFVRATRLICALELIRRERTDLGVSPISIGMWVGDATSPNTFSKAADLVAKACRTNDRPALVIDRCPWCGDSFEASRNYASSAHHFHFLCKNTECSFGNTAPGKLPCNVVDEALYADPPTMLVATVDKFARLAWEERTNAFFGGTKHLPPELIIQDELHLIAGALGSVAGLYEAAVDAVIQLRGLYPKYIASTATIRMASQQVKRLYGRDVAVFPPPGLSCDDSFFARTVPVTQRPGRTYVGYLAPMLNRQECMAPLAAALLLAPNTLFTSDQDQSELRDAWWTQMVYHGSLNGVGNSHTAFARAVRDFMVLLSPQLEPGRNAVAKLEHPDGAQIANRKSSRQSATPSIAQLTSQQTAEQNAEIFARLNLKCDEQGCLDAVLATNMISVGLDVGRLGLMVINGQPLTTAEYIQASSRVGRSDVPGLVFANYYRDQARSLSHYESFRPYHDAFYRFVEPTSVTPHTYQARLRALHAALVIVIRHSVPGMLINASAGEFDPSNLWVHKAIDHLKRRCKQASSEDFSGVATHINSLVIEWENEVERCRNARRKLEYQAPDRDTGRDRLLFNHDDRIRGLWPTLQSLRHVENSALLKVI